MGVFDSISITSPSLNVTIQKATGPLEQGTFEPQGGTWVPVPVPQVTGVIGFGIDSSGSAYFQDGAADPGDARDLWVDPSAAELFLQ